MTTSPKKHRDLGTEDLIKAWETDAAATSYSLDNFYFKASDVKGHSGTVHLRLLPDLLAQLEIILQKHVFPYVTVQDVIRDAVVHRIQYLRQKIESGELDTMFIRTLTIDNILREEEFAQRFQEQLERLTSIVEGHTSSGGEAEAARIVREVLTNLEAMPESYRRDKSISIIYTRFGYLLRGDHAKPNRS